MTLTRDSTDNHSDNPYAATKKFEERTVPQVKGHRSTEQ